MRRILGTTLIAGLALAFVPLSTPATACDPNRPPWCENVCTIVPPAYYTVHRAAGGSEGPLPSWYQLNLGVCGS